MNKEFNKAILELAPDELKNHYISIFESINDGFDNIYYLLEYIVNENDNNVSDSIKDYIVEYFDLESKRNINKSLFEPLLEQHKKLYEESLEIFYSSYSMLDNSIELLKELHDEDFEQQFIEVIDNLETMNNTIHIISEHILHYCATDYLCKKYNINMGMIGSMEFKLATIEYTHIRNKILKLLYAYKNKDYDDSDEKISIYDENGLAKYSANVFMNEKFPNAVNIMDEMEINYDRTNLFMFCFSYYCALWNILLIEARNKKPEFNDFKNTLQLIFLDASKKLKEINKTNKDYYKKLEKLYDKAFEQYQFHESDLISLDAIGEIHKSFVKEVANIDRTYFTSYYINIYKEIHNALNGSNSDSSTDTEEEFTCGNCGKVVDADAIECPYCGAEFE